MSLSLQKVSRSLPVVSFQGLVGALGEMNYYPVAEGFKERSFSKQVEAMCIF